MDNNSQQVNGVNDKGNESNNKETNSTIATTTSLATTKATPPRDAPPPTPIAKGLNLSGPLIKKDKRQSSSRFNISKNQELTPLAQLKGKSKTNYIQMIDWK